MPPRASSSSKPSKHSKLVAQRYVVTAHIGNKSHRKGQARRSNNDGVDGVDAFVQFSRLNPDEDKTVARARPCLQAAIAHERSLAWKLRMWWYRSGWCPENATPCVTGAPTRILDHVVLGGDAAAANRSQLTLNGVTHICNCAAQTANHFEGDYVYLHLRLQDAEDEQLTPHFQTVTAFLRHVEQIHGRVLVHCIAGASRSPAFVIAYLMTDKRMTLRDAYSFVRRRRPCVQPNTAFRLQLAQYELALYGGSSVAATPDKDWDFFAWNEFKSTKRLIRI